MLSLTIAHAVKPINEAWNEVGKKTIDCFQHTGIVAIYEAAQYIQFQLDESTKSFTDKCKLIWLDDIILIEDMETHQTKQWFGK